MGSTVFKQPTFVAEPATFVVPRAVKFGENGCYCSVALHLLASIKPVLLAARRLVLLEHIAEGVMVKALGIRGYTSTPTAFHERISIEKNDKDAGATKVDGAYKMVLGMFLLRAIGLMYVERPDMRGFDVLYNTIRKAMNLEYNLAIPPKPKIQNAEKEGGEANLFFMNALSIILHLLQELSEHEVDMFVDYKNALQFLTYSTIAKDVNTGVFVSLESPNVHNKSEVFDLQTDLNFYNFNKFEDNEMLQIIDFPSYLIIENVAMYTDAFAIFSYNPNRLVLGFSQSGNCAFYRLVGRVKHVSRNAHYVCDILDRKTNTVYRINDDTIARVGIDNKQSALVRKYDDGANYGEFDMPSYFIQSLPENNQPKNPSPLTTPLPSPFDTTPDSIIAALHDKEKGIRSDMDNEQLDINSVLWVWERYMPQDVDDLQQSASLAEPDVQEQEFRPVSDGHASAASTSPNPLFSFSSSSSSRPSLSSSLSARGYKEPSGMIDGREFFKRIFDSTYESSFKNMNTTSHHTTTTVLTNVTLMPCNFKESGNGEKKFADFMSMVTMREYEDTLFVFNDNEECFLDPNRQEGGSGNGDMRFWKYNNDKPRAWGIPTGVNGSGYPNLTTLNKWMIAEAIWQIRFVVDKYGYKRVAYSADENGKIGFAYYTPGPDVIENISSTLKEVFPVIAPPNYMELLKRRFDNYPPSDTNVRLFGYYSADTSVNISTSMIKDMETNGDALFLYNDTEEFFVSLQPQATGNGTSALRPYKFNIIMPSAWGIPIADSNGGYKSITSHIHKGFIDAAIHQIKTVCRLCYYKRVAYKRKENGDYDDESTGVDPGVIRYVMESLRTAFVPSTSSSAPTSNTNTSVASASSASSSMYPGNPFTPRASYAHTSTGSSSYSSSTSSTGLRVTGYTFNGRDKLGDIKWMITQPRYKHILFAYNDTQEAYSDGSLKTGGKGIASVMRQYRDLSHDYQACPIPIANTHGGYTKLTDDVKTVIDLAIDRIATVATHEGSPYTEVAYQGGSAGSATGTKYDGEDYGASRDVLNYISSRLNAIHGTQLASHT